MQKFHRWILTGFRRKFFLGLLFLCLLIPVLLQDQKKISTEVAPKGIVSLELSYSHAKSNSIKESWQACYEEKKTEANCTTLSDIARYDIFIDYFFIIAYCFFLLILLSRVNSLQADDIFLLPSLPAPPLKKHTAVLMTCTLAAGLLDYIENLFMYQFLESGPVNPLLYSIPATIKFLLLLVVGGYLLFRLTRRILMFVTYSGKNLGLILYNYRIVVIGLLVLYIILWIADQGQDLLLNLNTEWYGPFSFLVTIVVLAILNWHLPKYFTDRARTERLFEKLSMREVFFPKRDVWAQDDQKERNIARMLGVLTFLVPAGGIWNALQQFNIPFKLSFISPYVLLFVSTLAFAVAFRSRFVTNLYRRYPRATGRVVMFIVVLFVGVMVFIPFLPNLSSPDFLVFMVLDLYLLAILFSLFSSLRTLMKWGFMSVVARNIFSIIMVTGLLFTVLFLVLNTYPLMMINVSRYITFGVVITGVIFYTYLLSLLALAGRRWRINFILLAIVIGSILQVSGVNDFHNVRTLSRRDTDTIPIIVPKTELDSLDVYLAGWLNHRRDSIEAWSSKGNGRKYPVFIVNTYGGGIRAAAWTSMVIAYLDEVMKLNNKQSFQHYVLAYSGASGGTVGAAVNCAYRYAHGEQRALSNERLFTIYAKDYLTAVLIGLQGRDIWFAPFRSDGIADRAEYQERMWEDHLRNDTIPFDVSYFRLWYDTTSVNAFEVPLLFSNTYNVDHGRKGVLAPVLLRKSEFPGANFINDLYDIDRTDSTTENLRLSTGAFLSARFPYISPTARFSDGLHFLDGGLKENSGAETASQLYRAIERIKSTADSTSLLQKVEFHILSIRNTFENLEPANKADNISEITAPLTGLVNNFVGNSIQADSVNLFQLNARKLYHAVHPYPVLVQPNNGKNPIRPILPLGWQISDLALQGMRTSLARRQDSLPNILRLFNCNPAVQQQYNRQLIIWPEKK
ncbi:MAG TPA: patatin-like phospholipase family protein [Chitinophagaceae bacterium]|nr:patatin-like phospholipase family protein [Chitinophagaceae bacterium]